MIKVQRANVILEITDEEVAKFMNLGYNVIDNAGNIVKEAVPTDLAMLQADYIENRRKIKLLEEEIEQLKNNTQERKKASRRAEN